MFDLWNVIFVFLNPDDILNALLKLQATSDLPPIVLSANDIVRLPKYSPGELLEPSLAERLAVVEGQLFQLNDTVSCNATKRTTIEKRCDQLEKRMQNVAPAAKSRPVHNNAKSCEIINSAASSHQAWHNVPLAVRLPPNMRRRSGRKCIEMAKWFESARGGTESAREGTESAREGTESAREGTESAREGTESAREGTESAREGIESAREGTESAREGTESALVSLR